MEIENFDILKNVIVSDRFLKDPTLENLLLSIDSRKYEIIFMCKLEKINES